MATIYKVFLACCTSLLLLFSSCSSDDILRAEEEGNGMVNISLTIDTGDNIMTRGKGDPNANRGEFINTLVIFIVDENGKIEQKLRPDLTMDELAKCGNLSSWYSGTFDITTGRKSLYAFANWETASSVRWNAIIDKNIGETLNAKELDFAVDAASGIEVKEDERGFYLTKFIPMSAKSDVSLHVTGGPRSVEINLERLASRVEVDFENKEEEEITLNASIGKFAPAVSVFHDATPVYQRENTYKRLTISPEGDKFAPADGNIAISKKYCIYVNETKADPAVKDNRFELTVDIKGSLGTDKSVVLKTGRSFIDRNSIYPILLSYSQYELHMDIIARVAPIGIMPIETHSRIGMINDYAIDLPEGCRFDIEVGLYSDNQTLVEGLTYTWHDVKGVLEGATVSQTGNGIKHWSVVSPKITGHIPSLPHGYIFLTLNITGKNGEKYPNYYIGIDPLPLEDYFMKHTKSADTAPASTWKREERSCERLTLFANRKGGIAL